MDTRDMSWPLFGGPAAIMSTADIDLGGSSWPLFGGPDIVNQQTGGTPLGGGTVPGLFFANG